MATGFGSTGFTPTGFPPRQNAGGTPTLGLPAIASGATLHAPSVRHVLAPPAIASSASLAAPSVAYRIAAPTIAASSTVSAPSLAARVVLPTVASGASLAPPTIALSGGPLSLSLPFLAAAAVLRAPSLALRAVLPTIASAAVIRQPSLLYGLQLPTVFSASAAHPPTLAPEWLLQLPTLASSAAVFVPDVSGGAIPEPIDPPVVTQWRDPRFRALVVHGLRAYGVRLGVGTVPAGGTKVVVVPIAGVTDRELWFVHGIAPSPVGVYLRNVWLTVPGRLAFVYVNRTGVDRYLDYHDTAVLVLQQTGPVP